MTPGALKSHQFRETREDEWRRLDRILKRAESQSLGALSDEDLIALPVLYRSTLSGLATARATSLDASLIEYLESLCERAYYFLYGVRGRTGQRLAEYLARGLPAAIKGIWKETLVSALLFFAGATVAYLLVQADPDWYFTFVSEDMAAGRDPSATQQELRRMLYDGQGGEYSGFATMLFTHNSTVCLMSFALGFALCVPTAVLIFTNGCLLGAMMAVFASKGLGYEFTGWLSIHGVTELFAIILSGAAGIRVGWNVGFPGARSRMDALRSAGRSGAAVMGGVVIMLLFAGFLEGFARQLITDDEARYGIALTTGVAWFAYYYLPRRKCDG